MQPSMHNRPNNQRQHTATPGAPCCRRGSPPPVRWHTRCRQCASPTPRHPYTLHAAAPQCARRCAAGWGAGRGGCSRGAGAHGVGGWDPTRVGPRTWQPQQHNRQALHASAAPPQPTRHARAAQKRTSAQAGAPWGLGLPVLTLPHVSKHQEAEAVGGPRGHRGAELHWGAALHLRVRGRGGGGGAMWGTAWRGAKPGGGAPASAALRWLQPCTIVRSPTTTAVPGKSSARPAAAP